MISQAEKERTEARRHFTYSFNADEVRSAVKGSAGFTALQILDPETLNTQEDYVTITVEDWHKIKTLADLVKDIDLKLMAAQTCAIYHNIPKLKEMVE